LGPDDLGDRIEAVLGQRPARLNALGAGAAGQVMRLSLHDGTQCVAKTAMAGGQLDLEGWMLSQLRVRSRLPVPRVHYADASLLIMDYVAGDCPLDSPSERDAADHIAALHDIRADQFGLERDTLIGPLAQPNGWCDRWSSFYAERRLMPFAQSALKAGGISFATMDRVARLATRIAEFIEEPDHPSLIHGDLWGGNIIARSGRITGFIDPAIHFAHAEVELAFTTLFNTFGPTFFARYQEHRPIAPGFFDARKDLYLLYPLLVHATLFGTGYGNQADAILRRAVG